MAANRISVTKFDSSKIRYDDNGNMIVPSTPARAGIQIYFDEYGNKIKELRHPDDVFSRETLDSFKTVPYTVEENHVSMFTPSDTRIKSYGVTHGEAKKGGDYISQELKVWDKSEIDAIKSGNESLELSVGYRCDFDETPGIYKGESYDRRQINIRANHIARVKNARGGKDCKIRLDSNSMICGVDAGRIDSNKPEQKENKMSGNAKEIIVQRELPERKSGDFRLDSSTVSIPKEQESVLNSVMDREAKVFNALKDSETKLIKAEAKLDSKDVELKTANTKISDLEKKLENSVSVEKLDSEIDKRSKLYTLADAYKVDYKEKSIEEIEKAVITGSGMFSDRVKARLDSAEARAIYLEELENPATKEKKRSRDNLNYHLDNKDDFNFNDSDDDALENI